MTVTPGPLDGIASPAKQDPTSSQQDPEVVLQKRVRALKSRLLVAGLTVYGLYAFVVLTLITLLPDPTGRLQSLASVGIMICLGGLVVCLGLGAVLYFHISGSDSPSAYQRAGLVRLGLGLAPGILLSVIGIFALMQEPTLRMDIVSPTSAADLIAPLPVTLSVEAAVQTLENMQLKPIQYRWDLNGDGKVDQETTVPTITATFEKDGVYVVQTKIVLADLSERVAARRLLITKSVFAMTPPQPIVERPVTFSISNLVPDRSQVQQVTWDFDGDGTVDVTTKDVDVRHTFYALGPVKVTMTVQLANRALTTYSRTVTVQPPPPLPFPVSLRTKPGRLISTPPFGVEFSVETDEPVADIEWNVGEGDIVHQPSVVHTYDQKGKFPVVVKVRSASGLVAELTTTVRVVDELVLQDFTYEGGLLPTNGKLSAEAPVALELTPKTATPFVMFSWDAPGATELGSTGTTLRAVYRDVGTYEITLFAEDRQDHVRVIPLTLEVKPPSSNLVIQMEPEGGAAPLTVRFDASESFIPNETISGFVWTFGDRTPQEFGSAQVSHTFQEPGTYTIELSVKTTSKKEFRTSRSIVVREPLLRACFEASRVEGVVPLGVLFDATCTMGEEVELTWDFDDGGQSDQRDVVHTFREPGVYNVILTATDAGGRTDTESLTITATAP